MTSSRPLVPMAGAIKDYLRSTLDTEVTLVGRAPGASHEGWVFRRAGEPPSQLLVRMEPDEGPFLNYDAAAEATLLRELRERGLPVPDVLAVGGREVCGSRFVVLDWIDGVVLNPQAVARWPRTERIAHARQLATTLAGVHRFPWNELSGAGRPFPAGPDHGVTAYLREFDVMLTKLERVGTLVLDFVRIWLERQAVGRTGPLSLVHGDFRLGNLVWREGRIAGILDWETARIGNPIFDLAWLCMGATDGDDVVMGLVSRDEIVELYAAASGLQVAPRDLLFWQVVAAWVRGCTEARLLDIALTSHAPAERDARDISWEFGSHRTDEELLTLIATFEELG